MSEIQIRRHGPVMVIQINRPAVRNAINARTAMLLRNAWLEFDEDESARVGILTGTDEVFSAGADLKEAATGLPQAPKGAGPLGIGRMMVSKPTIAAVAGYAVAGGFELALWCDLCIADETAIFGFFERKWGVPLLNGGSKRLAQIVGLRRALDIVLTGRPVQAAEALQIGLATEVVPAGQALKRALELAEHLARVPQAALRSDRRALYDNFERDMDDALIHEAWLAQQTIASGEPAREAARFRADDQKGPAQS
jgi:enoyl-CoA hydratase